MSKLTGLPSIFRKISVYRSNMGFYALKFSRSPGRCWEPRATYLVVIERDMISQSYMDKILMPVVMAFLFQNQCQYQALDEHISPKFYSSEQCCVHWLASALIRHIYTWTCVGHFGQRDGRKILAARLDVALQDVSRLIPVHQITSTDTLFAAYTDNTRYWSHANMTFRTITFISCDI